MSRRRRGQHREARRDAATYLHERERERDEMSFLPSRYDRSGVEEKRSSLEMSCRNCGTRVRKRATSDDKTRLRINDRGSDRLLEHSSIRLPEFRDSRKLYEEKGSAKVECKSEEFPRKQKSGVRVSTSNGKLDGMTSFSLSSFFLLRDRDRTILSRRELND